jgi:plasmid maintenance system antidote protein VapI
VLTGQLLKRMIAERLLTQTGFARKMGITEGYVRRLINENLKPSAKLESKMISFFATCWVCGSEWKDTPAGAAKHTH